VLNETTFEHLHRYALALPYASGKTVLDIACGAGYGSALLAKTAAAVTGVDIDTATVQAAAERYQAPNLQFRQGSITSIPLPEDSFDVVVSFETLEHLAEHDQMLCEIRRVLRPGGLLVISSPDKEYYTDVPQYHNPFHVKELYKEEFRRLLQQYFPHVQLLTQQSFTGSVILNEQQEGTPPQLLRGGYDAVQPAAWQPPYCIALASDAAFTGQADSFFSGNTILETRLQQAEQEMLQAVRAELAQQLTHEIRTAVTREVTDTIRGSRTYRLGAALLWPFRKISQQMRLKP
jgi:ubiquinone/menaquinone biosynthesis C-methylase UbiE